MPEKISLDLTQAQALDLQVFLYDVARAYAFQERMSNETIKWRGHKVKALAMCNQIRKELGLELLTLE